VVKVEAAMERGEGEGIRIVGIEDQNCSGEKERDEREKRMAKITI